MKISRLLIIISVAVTTLLVSCEDYEDTVVPSPTVSADMNVVSFTADNPTEYEFSPLDTEFKLTVKRSSSSGALEVPISIITNTDNSFTVPGSVSFAAGEDTAILAITIDYANATLGVDLKIGIKVGDANNNPYKVQYGEYYATVAILDWQKYAEGTYYSMLYDDSWTQDLYKLVGEDTYRFFDLYADGIDLTFTWAGGESLSFEYPVDADGYYIWVPGIDYADYGSVTVLWDSSPSWTFYTEATKEFQLEGNWTVAAGSLGWLDDYFTITSLY